VAGILGQVFFPLPDLTQARPWNTSWLLTHASWANSLLGAVCFGLAIWCVGSRRWSFFLVLAAIGILALPVLAPYRSIRYYGPVWMAFLAACWMVPDVFSRAKRAAILGLLVLQIPGAVVMTAVTQRLPRSQAEHFVDQFRQGPYKDLPVMVHPYQAVPAISGYLGAPVYGPATASSVSYCDWTFAPFRLDREALLVALSRSPYPKAVLVADEAELPAEGSHGLRITPLMTFEGAQIQSEQYRVYLVEKSE
jgi:hypothetical protein